jgi:hypothetical protein
VPIPEGPDAAALPKFSGHPATPHPVRVPDPPRHPFMAPNGRSNLHVDGYQSDVHQGPGPLGRQVENRSTFLEGVCASVTFDSRGRIETVCVGAEGPKLLLLEPRTLETLAAFPLPPRVPGAGNLFTDFAGGGYFYLDNHDRAVIPTTKAFIPPLRSRAIRDQVPRSAHSRASGRSFGSAGTSSRRLPLTTRSQSPTSSTASRISAWPPGMSQAEGSRRSSSFVRTPGGAGIRSS